MRALALCVPRSEGERWRRRLAAAGHLRDDLSVRRTEAYVYLPIRDRIPLDDPRLRIEEVELRERRRASPRSYAELAEVPSDLRRRLPRSFDVVGEVVLVRVPPELEAHATAIGEALLRFVPGARIVGADEGVVGPRRTRALRRLAGTGEFRTRVRENGLALVVDPERAYYSPRLAREHARVAALVRPGERVLDLCCGIGPFALTIARNAPSARIEAVDANPDAIALLRENLRRLHLGATVRSDVADAGEFLATAGPFDRIVLNLPHEGARWLSAAGAHLELGGTLHYYEIVPRRGAADRAEQIVAAALGRSGQLVEAHVVHEYSPGSDLRAHTIRRSGP